MRSLFGWARALEAGERVGHGVLSQERDQFGLTSLEDLPVVDAAVAERLTIPEAEAAPGATPAASAGGTGDRTGAGQPAGRPR